MTKCYNSIALDNYLKEIDSAEQAEEWKEAWLNEQTAEAMEELEETGYYSTGFHSEKLNGEKFEVKWSYLDCLLNLDTDMHLEDINNLFARIMEGREVEIGYLREILHNALKSEFDADKAWEDHNDPYYDI